MTIEQMKKELAEKMGQHEQIKAGLHMLVGQINLLKDLIKKEETKVTKKETPEVHKVK